MSESLREPELLAPGKRRAIAFLLRGLGVVSLGALVAVMMPHAWMERIHERIGLGTLPDLPMVAYLSRSLSLFYAWIGVLVIWTSFDVERYLSWIRIFAISGLVVGVVQTAIDYLAPVPVWWLIAEGSFLFLYFGALTWLARK